jgi:hypothetical protein
MMEPGTGDRFFTDLAQRCIRRVAHPPRAGWVDHPHRAVAVNPRHNTYVRPVLAGVGVAAEIKNQVASSRAGVPKPRPTC